MVGCSGSNDDQHYRGKPEPEPETKTLLAWRLGPWLCRQNGKLETIAASEVCAPNGPQASAAHFGAVMVASRREEKGKSHS